MSCDPVIDDFSMNGFFYGGFLYAGSPISFHVALSNKGGNLGTIVVNFDAAPALTNLSEDMWYAVDVRSFRRVGPGASLSFDHDLDLTTEDAQIRAVAVGRPTGAPLPGAAQFFPLVVV